MDLGAEYNYQWNQGMVQDHHLAGLSFYGSYQVKHTRFFGRYDNLSSTVISGDTDPWNYEDDGHLFIAGIEFHPVKGLIVTPPLILTQPAPISWPGLNGDIFV